MDVSIIIVNYKSPQFTIDCIESIYKFTTDVQFEIIVVENFSQDNSIELITSKFTDVIVLQMTDNIGYSRANNEGMKIAKGKYNLVLNNDTIFVENILLPLVQLLDGDKSVSAACVGMYFSTGIQQASGFNFIFGGLNIVLTLPLIATAYNKIKNTFNIKKQPSAQSSGIAKIDWISGAFMFVRKSAIDKVGMFDDDFFLFSEEIEWCARLNNTGKLIINYDLSIIHLIGQTIDNQLNTDKDTYYPYWQVKGLQQMVSNLLYVRKQYGLLMMFIHVLIFFGEIPVFFFGVVFSKLLFKNSALSFNQFAKYVKNYLILWKYIFPIAFKERKLYKVYP